MRDASTHAMVQKDVHVVAKTGRCPACGRAPNLLCLRPCGRRWDLGPYRTAKEKRTIRKAEEVAVWRRRPEDPVDTLAADLTLECEALLAGRYAEFLCSRGRPAPPWTWVNALAHRSASEITALAGGEGHPTVGGPPDAHQWHRALAFLAVDVVGQVQRSGISLGELQRTRLIPLELELCRNPDRGTDLGHLAGLVMAVIRRRPSRRQP